MKKFAAMFAALTMRLSQAACGGALRAGIHQRIRP